MWQIRTISNIAGGGESSGAITYSSDKESSVATVNSSGLVTIIGAGTATITATKEGDAIYNSTTNSYVLTVLKARQTGFDFTQDVLTIEFVAGRTTSNIATGGESVGAIIIYSIDNTSVATINPNRGVVTLKSIGTATITASKAGNANYLPTSATYELRALPALITLGIKNMKFAWSATTGNRSLPSSVKVG